MPENIADFISRVFKRKGVEKANVALDFIIILRSQILLALVCFYTLKEEYEKAVSAFIDFNDDLTSFSKDFLDTTSCRYLPGKGYTATSNEDKMYNFLKLHGLLELENLVEEIDLDQLKSMKDEEIKVLIDSEKQREALSYALSKSSRYPPISHSCINPNLDMIKTRIENVLGKKTPIRMGTRPGSTRHKIELFQITLNKK